TRGGAVSSARLTDAGVCPVMASIVVSRARMSARCAYDTRDGLKLPSSDQVPNQTTAIRSGATTPGNGRKNNQFATPIAAMVGPVLSATVAVAAIRNPGVRRSARAA